MFLRVALLVWVSLVCGGLVRAAEKAAVTPVAIVFGQHVYAKDLVVPGGAKATDAATAELAKGEALGARVRWGAS